MGKLTAQEVKNAKLEPEKKFVKKFDGQGLFLLINSVGKYWRYQYRFIGKQKTLAIGVYPSISLKEARKRHQTARELLEKGIDPSQQKKAIKNALVEAHENSFSNVSERWFVKQNWTDGHRRTVRSRLDRDIIPWLGNRPIAEITAADCLQVCRKVESRGAIESAHRIKTIISQVMRFAVAESLVTSDPTRDLRNALTAVQSRSMTAITEVSVVGQLMRDIEDYKGSAMVRAALKFSAYTFGRPGEVRHAEWSEIDFEKKLWRIPAAKMKRKREHLVPLSGQLLDVLVEIQVLTGNGQWVFPGARHRSRPMSENTVLSALRKLGYSKEQMTAHGFRGMASTLLHEAGCPHELIEIQLSHAHQNSVAASYNHAQHLSDRRVLIQYWSDTLDALQGEKPQPVWKAYCETIK